MKEAQLCISVFPPPNFPKQKAEQMEKEGFGEESARAEFDFLVGLQLLLYTDLHFRFSEKGFVIYYSRNNK